MIRRTVLLLSAALKQEAIRRLTHSLFITSSVLIGTEMGGTISRKPFRVLMAGPGKAGKSTVQKAVRMTMSYNEEASQLSGKTPGDCVDKAVGAAYSEEERKLLLKKIRRSIIDSMLILTKTLRENDAKFKPTSEEKKMLRKIPHESLWGPLEMEQAEAIASLWKSGLLKRVFDDMFLRDENSVDSSAPIFLPQATRFAGKDDAHNKLLPIDILIQREETKKIEVSEFVYPPNAPPDEQTEVHFLDIGGQQKWLNQARTDPTYKDFVFRSRSYFIMVPIGDFDVLDQGVDRVSASFKVLLDLFYMKGDEFSPRKKTFVVFLNKSDIFKQKLDDGRFKRFQAETKGHDWQSELNPMLKRLDEEFEEEKKHCCNGMLPRCCPGVEFTEQGLGEGTPYAEYIARKQCVQELIAALSAKYTGPDGDEEAAIKFFNDKVQKIINTAKVVPRNGAGPGRCFEGQSMIEKSTATDFGSIREILRGKVFNYRFLAVGLMDEVGLLAPEDEVELPQSPGARGASTAVMHINPMQR